MNEITTADHVLHKPSGETWVVAYVKDGWLVACGWPKTRVPVQDCSLVYKATDIEYSQLLYQLARSKNTLDTRVQYAKQVLGL